MLAFLFQFLLELLHALLVEELSSHVRKHAKGFIARLRSRSRRGSNGRSDTNSPQVTHRK